MEEKIIIDTLTSDSVSIKKEYIQDINGIQTQVGEPWRKAYINSVQGRDEVKAELSEIYVNSIFSVWGDTATVSEEKAEGVAQ